MRQGRCLGRWGMLVLGWLAILPLAANDLPNPSGVAPSAPQSKPSPAAVKPRLTIKAEPASAQVQLVNNATRYSPGIRLAPGRYQIRVTCPDYLPATRWVELGQKDQTLTVKLKVKPREVPVTYRLKVITDPPGAQVSVSDTESEYTPEGVLLPPGVYSVGISQTGYLPQQLDLTLRAADQTLTVKLEPIPVPPVVSVPVVRQPAVPAPDPLRPELAALNAGCMQAGSPATEAGHRDNERQHQICVQAFALANYEVTVGEFRQFVTATGHQTSGGCWAWDGRQWAQNPDYHWDNPGFPQTETHPVVCVSWDDVQAYLAWLNRASGQKFRLPTEAEWEYAARAQALQARFWGDAPEQACDYANVADQSSAQRFRWDPIHACDDGQIYTAPIGSYRANAWGLHDMLGNAAEWTCSEYDKNFGDDWALRCARAEATAADSRVIRGGSWTNVPDWVRSAQRIGKPPAVRLNYVGFRLARD